MEEIWKNSAIITKRNVDDGQNPISVQLSELKQIIDVHSCVVLNQLPDEFHGIYIDGYTEIYDIEKVSINNYKVDYANGVIYFHPNNIGKILNVDYYGIGHTLLSASRIYTKYDKNGGVLETLEELLDKGKLYIEAIETLGGAVEVVNEMRQSIADGTSLHENLLEDISIGSDVRDDLEAKTDIANTTINSLVTKTQDGNNTVSQLIEKNAIATEKKQALDESIQSATDTNTTLSNTNQAGTQINLTLQQTMAEASDDIATINATGNKSLIIGASNFTNGEYTWTHSMNNDNLIVSILSTDTNEPIIADYKIIDKNNILIRNSEENPNLKVILSASYYQGNSVIGSTVEEFLGDSIGTDEDKVRLRGVNGEVQNPVTNSDAVFMSDGVTKLTNKISDITDEIDEARGANQFLGDRLDNIDASLEDNIQQIKKKENSIFNINQLLNRKNSYYNYSIGVMADSISHGADAIDLANDSWTGIMRKSLQRQFGSTNHGYVSMKCIMTNATGTLKDIIDIEKTSDWTLNYDFNVLNGFSAYSSTNGGILTITVKKNTKKVQLHYVSEVGGGSFDVKDINDNILLSGSTNGESGKNVQTASIDTTNLVAPFVLKIVKTSTGQTKFNGVVLYDNALDIMFNNYSLTGIKLSDIPNNVIDIYAKNSILFFALGTNDRGANATQTFTEKINYCIEAFNREKTFIVIQDFMWQSPYDNHFRKELRRLYENVPNSIILEYPSFFVNSTNNQDWINAGLITSTLHPTEYFHELIFEITAKKIGLTYTSKKELERLENEESIYFVEEFKNNFTDSFPTDKKLKTQVVKNKNIINIQMYVNKGNATSGLECFTIPSSLAPKIASRFIVNIDGDSSKIAYLEISNKGVCKLYWSSAYTSNYIYGIISYVI